MFFCCQCRVLSGRGLCDELITSPEESYRLWCVVVCDLETSRMRRPWPALGRSATARKSNSSNSSNRSSIAIIIIIIINRFYGFRRRHCPSKITHSRMVAVTVSEKKESNLTRKWPFRTQCSLEKDLWKPRKPVRIAQVAADIQTWQLSNENRSVATDYFS